MLDVRSGESSSDSDFSDYVSLPDEESTEIDSDVPLSVYAKAVERVFGRLSSGGRRTALR